MNEQELITEVRTFFRAWITSSLATVDADGLPHAANVQFAVDDSDMSLLFVSGLQSAHSQHIASQPRVAMTVYAHTDDWSQIHGVQLHGLCHRLTDPAAIEQAFAIYTARFPFILQVPSIVERVRSESFFKVSPTWLRWIDNRRGFGFRQEMHLSA